MKVGIIFAMEEELKELVNYLKVTREYFLFDLKFYEGTIHGVNCILVESGVGKVNAARTCQILIDNMKVDCIFNIGVAGGISQDVSVLDIVIGESLVQHDFDITAFDHEKGYIPKVGTNIFSDTYLLKLAKESISKLTGSKVLSGVIASGDIFCTEKAMCEKINKKFNALCVEMEGASIAQVAWLNHIPFLVIRSISDTIDGDHLLTYEAFLEKSSKTIALFMNFILEKLSDNNF